MASLFVHGPVHLYVGIEFILIPSLGLAPSTPPDTQLSTFNSSPITYSESNNEQTPPSGGTLANGEPQQPPPTLVQNALLVNRLPVYLGTAEKSVSIEFHTGWLPWFDDEEGGNLPADELFEQEEAWIEADVSRWNEPVYAFIAQRVNRAPAGGGRGIQFAGDVGTSVLYEGYTYPLLLQFPFAGKPGYQLRGMAPGYRFLNTILAGPDYLAPLGTQPSKRRLLWRARTYLDLDSGASGLYDFNLSALNGIGIN